MSRWLSVLLIVTATTLAPVEASSQASPRPTQGSTPTVLSTAQIAAAAGSAVVTIVTFDRDGKRLAQGSGFIVTSDGVIVTNWHVVVGASRASVSLRSGESFDRVSFLDGDQSADIVLLKIPSTGLPFLATTSEIPAAGSRIVALGSPLGLTGTVSEGIVSAVRLAEGKQSVQVTAAISPGSSGGPIIDAAGRAFAIATESIEGRGVQQLNFAVPVKYALGLMTLQPIGRPLADSPVGEAARRDEFAMSARDFNYWSQPGRTADPLPSVVGKYFFVLRTVSRSSGKMKSKNLGILVLGKSVGLLVSPNVKEGGANVAPVELVTSFASGEVAIEFNTALFRGYQTREGFWVSSDSPSTDETTEIQTSRYAGKLTESNGLYSVETKTKSIGEVTFQGTAFPLIEEGIVWTGEAAVYIVENKIYVVLLLENSGGGNVPFSASGPITDGAFDLRDGPRRLTGKLTDGRLEAQWIDQRRSDLRFEGPLRGQRK